MNDYVIITDSGCDLRPPYLEKLGVPYISLSLHYEGESQAYTSDDIPISEFYQKMREGAVAKTMAINIADFTAAFENILTEGKDVLYIGFSSGLSTTYSCSCLAAEELRKKYPERKLLTVDSLSASAGHGLIVKLTCDKKNAGATVEEAAAFAEDIRNKISIWFTVDTLTYLKRGGRVSPTAAFLGNMLGIKPILHMNDTGHLIPVSKVIGRKSSIAALVNKYGELSTDLSGSDIFISHSDCPEDAARLKEQIEEKYGAHVSLITEIGTVIGAHCGPGTLAVFFVGSHR